MDLKNIIETLRFNDKQSTRDMSADERIEYRNKKSKKRALVVRLRLIGVAFLIALLIVLAIIFIGSKKASKPVAEDQSLTIEDTSSTETSVEEETEEVEEEEITPKYSASETSATATISDSVISPYAIIINNDTDEIVAQKNAYDKIVPASMTKVMTVYSAYKHMTEEQLDEKVVLSSEAVAACYSCGCSTSGFQEGEEVTVRDLFYGTILPSGGDAAAQLAIYVGGDIDSFMDIVNEDLAELGLSETTHFTNPIGYYDEDHYSTVYDIAMIMKAAMEDDFLSTVLSTHVYNSTATNINPEGITISNWFLRRIEDKDFGGEIMGAKTGYVNQSGSCAVSCDKSESGTMYIVCTAKSTSSWNCIYDHVAIYSAYGK